MLCAIAFSSATQSNVMLNESLLKDSKKQRIFDEIEKNLNKELPFIQGVMFSEQGVLQIRIQTG